MIKLSILILTTPRRINTYYPNMLNHLLKQIGDRNDIEVLGLFDNKKRSIGEKRNNLLQMANGEYLTFIDDDDIIADEYIQSIMDAINTNPNIDCITYKMDWNLGFGRIINEFSKDFHYEHSGSNWKAKPNHMMIWKSSIAKKHLFKNISWQEDIDWAERASKDIVVESKIDKILYYYIYDGKTSESTKLSKGEI